VSKPTYIRIHCEHKRAADMERRPWRPELAGKAFAEEREGRWVCTCCKRPVAVVW
jgi:hypothetical protein